jgi:hypothetical protein
MGDEDDARLALHAVLVIVHVVDLQIRPGHTADVDVDAHPTVTLEGIEQISLVSLIKRASSC